MVEGDKRFVPLRLYFHTYFTSHRMNKIRSEHEWTPLSFEPLGIYRDN